MKCTRCGADLSPGEKFCGECGAPRPQSDPERSRGMPPRFAEAERRFAMLRAGYQAGELDSATYEAELQKLVVEDSSGGYWTLGADSGEWYWYDGQQWVRRAPPLAAAPVERRQDWPVPPAAVAPPMPALLPTRKEFPWKWIAVGGGGLLVVAAVVAGVLAVLPMLLPVSTPLEPTVALRQAQDTVAPAAPTATPILPTDTPTPVPPTATPTAVPPTVTPLPIATPTIEGLLFYDNFSDPASGWKTYAEEYGEVQYEEGTLALVAKGPEGEAAATLPGVQVQDFSLSFEATLMSDPGDWAYGVVFRSAPGGNAYIFTLTADGQYAIDEFVDMESVHLVNDTPSEAIETSGTNRIRIHADGPTLAFYVNDEQLARVTDARVREGPIELWAYVYPEQEIKVVFDNLVVVEPTASGEIAKPAPATPRVEPMATPTPAPLPPTDTPTPVPPTETPLPLNKIAFVSNRDGNYEIYIMNADGSGQTRLTNTPAEDRYPSWSPDGRRIAFASDRDGNMEIYVMNADGSGQTRLTNTPAYDGDPTWSPDGTRIAFASTQDVRSDIWVMNADGSNQVKLREFGVNPAWSPDGSQIAALFRFGSFMHLGVMPADGSAEPQPLLQLQISNWPAWSPDGSRIAFESTESPDNSEILIINADGSNLVNLTRTPNIVEVHPTWSPDGTRIAFMSWRDDNGEVYVMNADGSGQTNLTNNPAWEGYPSWSP
jgi:Tol biopolymer transport system component